MHRTYYPFHLFGATFNSDDEAQDFAFEQWEPEPAEDASDAEYVDWEERNPTWRLAQELEFYMDSDFVELLSCVEDVISQIASPREAEQIRDQASAFSHFILVMDDPDAIWADRRVTSTQTRPVIRSPESTATLTYLGRLN